MTKNPNFLANPIFQNFLYQSPWIHTSLFIITTAIVIFQKQTHHVSTVLRSFQELHIILGIKSKILVMFLEGRSYMIWSLPVFLISNHVSLVPSRWATWHLLISVKPTNLIHARKPYHYCLLYMKFCPTSSSPNWLISSRYYIFIQIRNIHNVYLRERSSYHLS